MPGEKKELFVGKKKVEDGKLFLTSPVFKLKKLLSHGEKNKIIKKYIYEKFYIQLMYRGRVAICTMTSFRGGGSGD